MVLVPYRAFSSRKTLVERKSRIPQVQGVEGEAVVDYAEPLTTQEMGDHRVSRRVNKMGFWQKSISHLWKSYKNASEPAKCMIH